MDFSTAYSKALLFLRENGSLPAFKISLIAFFRKFCQDKVVKLQEVLYRRLIDTYL